MKKIIISLIYIIVLVTATTILVSAATIPSTALPPVKGVVWIEENFNEGVVPDEEGWKAYTSDISSISVENGMLKLEKTANGPDATSPIMVYSFPEEISKGRLCLRAKMKSVGPASGGIGFFMFNTGVFREDAMLNFWIDSNSLKVSGFDSYIRDVEDNLIQIEAIADLENDTLYMKATDENGISKEKIYYLFEDQRFQSMKMYISTGANTIYFDDIYMVYEESKEKVTDYEIKLELNKSKMVVNGKHIVMPNRAAPIMTEGRVLIPIKQFAEAIGGSAVYEGQNNKLKVILGSKTIEFFIGKREILMNGKKYKMDLRATRRKNGNIMVPLRFITEILDMSIYTEGQKIIIINGSV